MSYSVEELDRIFTPKFQEGDAVKHYDGRVMRYGTIKTVNNGGASYVVTWREGKQSMDLTHLPSELMKQ